ncbi:MAG: ribbon-helix-helix protein, CopG family [Proteobacteria bacterium]|nr:ribbon-helix-helix protein, CopG family [Pseudomonadota bacterium]
MMRTTLTLDPDVARKVAELRQQGRRSLKEVINQALRAGLALKGKPGRRKVRFRVRAHHCGFRPGVDPERLNQLVDQLAADDFTREVESASGDGSAR